jgi:hypothetical protein
MNFKTTGLFALVLAVGIIAVVLLDKQDGKKEEATKLEGKLLAVEAETISEIILEPSGIHCVKDSGDWKIISPVVADAEQSGINAISEMFSWINIERSISSDVSEENIYGLSPEMGKMIVVHSSGIDTLFLGDKSPTGSFVFAKKSGSPDIFLTSTTLKSNIEKSLFDLRNKDALDFEKNAIRSFYLSCANGKFEIVKSAGSWLVKDGEELDTDQSEVNKIIDGLANERAKEFVDERPANLQRYGLQKPAIRIDLFLGENRAKKSLLIGKKSSSSYYAKDDSKNPVFLVDTSFVNILNTDLYTLRKKDLADFNSTDVNKLELEFSNQLIVCSKDTSGTWMVIKPAPRKAKSWEISSITRKAAQLEVVKFVDDQPSSLARYGLDSPSVKARFYKDDSLLLDVLLGKRLGDDVYAKLAGKSSVYLIEKEVLEIWTPNFKDISEDPKPSDGEATE